MVRLGLITHSVNQMLCSKYIPQPDLAFKMYCCRELSRPDINSGSKTACMGIGSRKNASRVSSMLRRTSAAEGAKHSMFARGFHSYTKLKGWAVL